MTPQNFPPNKTGTLTGGHRKIGRAANKQSWQKKQGGGDEGNRWPDVARTCEELEQHRQLRGRDVQQL